LFKDFRQKYLRFGASTIPQVLLLKLRTMTLEGGKSVA
jgi:hypothetical protein